MVEIYAEPELEEMKSPEVTKEWRDLAEKLGMEGQISLTNPSKDGEPKNPSPYLFMNQKLMKVFAILCPEVINYSKYDKSTIPNEVLKEILFAKEKNYFDKISIWYDDASPDPVVVGYIKNGEYDYTPHLIARFGDEVLPLEVLEDKAVARLKKHYKASLETALSGIDRSVYDFFNPSRWRDENLKIEMAGVTYSHKYGV